MVVMTLTMMTGITLKIQAQTADFWDLQIDNLYLKITSSTSSDTITADIVAIEANSNTDLNIESTYMYFDTPVRVSTVDLNNFIYGKFEVGNTLTFSPDIKIKSLRTACFKKIIIPDGITDCTFCVSQEGNHYVETVVLPNSISKIKRHMFYGCDKLKEVYCGNNLISIGEWAFNNCSSLKVITEDAKHGNTLSKCERVESYAFNDCSKLSEIYFSNSLKSIGYGSFSNCPLTDISLGSVKVIPTEAFRWARFKNLYFLNNVTTIESRALTISIQEEAVLPNSVTEIQSKGFYNCYFKKLVLGDSIKRLGYNAFCGGGIDEIDLGQVEVIEDYALNNTGLRTISLPPTVRLVFLNSFYSCYNVHIEDGDTPISFANQYKQPGFSGVIYIGRNLSGNYNDEHPSPFGNDIRGIEHLSFGDKVTRIPDNTFLCEIHNEVKLPSNIEYLGKNCMQQIKNTSLDLPASLDTIAAGAFGKATELKSVRCMAKEPPVCAINAFATIVYSTARLEVPDAEAYRNAPGWRNFRNIVTSGIGDNPADDNAQKVTVENGTIRIEGADGAEIYAADGRLVFSGSPASIPSLPSGLYLVRAGTTTKKIIL